LLGYKKRGGKKAEGKNIKKTLPSKDLACRGLEAVGQNLGLSFL
jgi:hypothetical protein